NFTYATNEYLTYEEPTYEREYLKSRIGYPLSQQWGYIADRLVVEDNEAKNSPVQNFAVHNVAGAITYKDVNGDGQITARDERPGGYPTVPEIIYGAGFSVGYKSFDVSAFVQGSAYSSFWTGGTVTLADGSTRTGPVNVQPFAEGK